MPEQTDVEMSPSKPYLLRAFYEWIVDNSCTPHIMVDTTVANVTVPSQYIEDDRIVLNISPLAVKEFLIDNVAVQFAARFASKLYKIYVPINAVIAIYARENGRGMVFGDDDDDSQGEPPPTATPPSGTGTTTTKPKGKPILKVVK